MMRATILLLGLAMANAGDTATCALNGMTAVDDLLDSAVFIWAAVKRCNKTLPAADQDSIRCTLNIASAVESTNKMVNVIAKALGQCGVLDGANAKCGMAVGQLTRTFAGLTAATAGILAKCPNKWNGNMSLETYAGSSGIMANPGLAQVSAAASAFNITQATLGTNVPGSLGECVINMKDSFKSLFTAMARIITIHDDCETSEDSCVHNGLKLAAGLASIGEYLAGTIGKCTNNAKLATNSGCAQESLAIVQQVSNLGRAGQTMKMHCGMSEERLYALEHGEIETSSPKSVTFVLCALLPLTAVLAFVGGSRFAKARTVEYDPELLRELE
jgi:hypothetical protein